MSTGHGKRNPVWPVLASLSALVTVAMVGHAEQLPLKSYRVAEGLPVDYVRCIKQDSSGFLWFGTERGVSRFDGQHFTHYGVKDGLSVPTTSDLIQTRQGTYWVATNGGGVFQMRPLVGTGKSGARLPDEANSRFKAYRVGEGPATNRVNVLFEDLGGRIWAGTDAGLFQLDATNGGTEFLPVSLGIPSLADSDVQIWSFAEDSEGSLWIGTKYGLVRRLLDGRTQHYSVQPLRSGRDLILVLRFDREGRLWIGHESWLIVFKPVPAAATITEPQARNLYPHSAWQRLQSGGGPDGPVTMPGAPGEARRYQTVARAFCPSSDGRFWIGSDQGLVEFDGQRLRRYTTANGLSGNSVETGELLEDRDGDLWIGIVGSGVMRLVRHGFVTYTSSDGLGNDTVGSILEGNAGEWYVITSGWRVNRAEERADGVHFTSVRLNLPSRITDSMWRSYRQIIRDRSGEWWVGTPEGLYRFPRTERIEQLAHVEPKAFYSARDGLVNDDVTYLFEDLRGDLWIATFAPKHEIITRWDRASGKFQRYSDRDGLRPFNAAFCFQQDKAGQVWIGFREGGLARYAAGRFTLFEASDGLPAGQVKSLHLDSQGCLWATASGGLARIEDLQAGRPSFTTFLARADISDSLGFALVQDRAGRIYVATARGVDRLDPSTARIKSYTAADGLPTTNPYVGFRDQQGRLWFGFGRSRGLVRLMPGPDTTESPPTVFIDGLQIDGEPYPVSDFGQNEVSQLELGPGQKRVQIDFFGLSSVGEPLQYQHKLEGAGQDWSAPSEQRTQVISLGPGVYRFLVRAVRGDGALSQSPATVSFSILPPVWQRWWFVGLVTILVVSAVAGFDRYRAARVKELGAALSESQKLTRALTEQDAELHRANQALELEYSITRTLAESGAPTEAAPKVLQLICESLGWEMGAIWNVVQPAQALRCLTVWHVKDVTAPGFEALTRQRTFVPGEGLPGRVLASGQAHWIQELSQDSNFPRIAIAVKEGLQSGFGFPVLLRGQVIGVMEFFSREQRKPDSDQIRMMSAIGSHLGRLIERKWAEEALRESETRFRTLAETASDAIITIDESSTIIFVNPAAENVFGYTLAEMQGANLTILMPDYLRHLHQAGMNRYIETGKRHLSWLAIELPGRHKTGREIPLEISFGEFARDGQRLFTGIVRDMTERKRAEEALRRSREERLEELERVRRRIAIDLHDDIGSSLTQISILSELVSRRVGPRKSTVSEPLQKIASTSRELVDSMSDIVWAINPQKDHLRDLVQRMRLFASESLTARNIAFQFRAPNMGQDVRLSANIRREVFLIFKESLNNLIRHARCTEATIELGLEADYLELRVTDNGAGFDPNNASDGHGLMSMRERANGIHGELQLRSAPGEGASITLRAPIDQAAAASGADYFTA
jgi:PAS domain S-box-containing protein